MKRTGIKTVFLSICMAGFLQMTVQAQKEDTVALKTRPSVHSRNLNLHLATGLQQSYFVEAGLAVSGLKLFPKVIRGYDYYLSLAAHPAFRKDKHFVWAAKAGGHFCSRGSVLGTDLIYAWDKDQYDVLITPKIGYGLSLLYVTYGYAFSTRSHILDRVGGHQVSLQVNLPFYSKNLVKPQMD